MLKRVEATKGGEGFLFIRSLHLTRSWTQKSCNGRKRTSLLYTLWFILITDHRSSQTQLSQNVFSPRQEVCSGKFQQKAKKSLQIGQPSTILDLRLKYEHFGTGFSIKNVCEIFLSFWNTQFLSQNGLTGAMIWDIKVWEGFEKRKGENLWSFAIPGWGWGGGRRGEWKSHTAFLEKYFFSEHVESF